MNDITELEKILKQMESKLNKSDLVKRVLLPLIKSAAQKNFDSKGRTGIGTDLFDGGNKKWAPLAKSTMASYKKKGISPLVATLARSGNLKESLNFSAVGNKVSIRAGGSDVPYAALLQFGGDVSGTYSVKQHKRKMTSAFGKKIKAKEVTVSSHKRTVNYKMPARPYIQLTQEDINEMAEFLQAEIGKIL